MHRSAPAAAGLLLLVAGLVASVGVWSGDPSRASGGDPATTRRSEQPLSATRPPADAGRWESVLARLLARRAGAYAAAEPLAMRTVHLPGSMVLREDAAALRAWGRRGLAVEGAMVRVRTAVLVRRDRRSAVLRTVDRLGPAVAVGRGGATRALPHDRPSAHRIVLARTSAGWRIAAVRALSG